MAVGYSKETDVLEPRSPYSSTKASADLLGQSYFSTYGFNGEEFFLSDHALLSAMTSKFETTDYHPNEPLAIQVK